MNQKKAEKRFHLTAELKSLDFKHCLAFIMTKSEFNKVIFSIIFLAILIKLIFSFLL